jgi:hypothetical protein
MSMAAKVNITTTPEQVARFHETLKQHNTERQRAELTQRIYQIGVTAEEAGAAASVIMALRERKMHRG